MMNNAGFTLLETLLYIALTALVLGGAVSATFGFSEASKRTNTKALREQEIMFVSKKLDWLLGGATSVTVTGSLSTITNPDLGSDSPVQVEINNNALYMDTAMADKTSLSSSWLAVTGDAAPFGFTDNIFSAKVFIGSEAWSYSYYVR